jgi:hypothetical protein
MPLQSTAQGTDSVASNTRCLLGLGDWRGSARCCMPSHIDAALQIRVVMFMRVRSGSPGQPQEPDTRPLPLHLHHHRLAAPRPLTPAGRPGPQASLPPMAAERRCISRRTITLVRAQRPNQPSGFPSTNVHYPSRTLSICHTTCITCVS